VTRFLLITTILILGGYLFWRHVWFFRNPSRLPPPGENIVSPADGTVVYVNRLEPRQDVITIKQGVQARVADIVREDLAWPKILVGIFMSPFSVHYNRVPLAGRVEFVHHHPPMLKNRCMASMHWRTLLKWPPLYKNSLHILSNERTVTKLWGQFKAKAVPYYIVQIAGRSVSGIDSYVQVGQHLEKGATFGMIRIGSQVDLVVPYVSDMQVMVKPGDKVRAGETIIIT
jgi:phosphatidylserine decarboxylase